jgi:hypothetical protein
MRLARLLALVAAILAPLGALATNLSDYWWNPAESGWGANIVQQDDTAVVTLFVYGPDGEPTWLFGVASTAGETPGGLPWFSGPLYRTKGSYFGGAWEPAKTQATQVGTLWLRPSSDHYLNIEYQVGGTTVNKGLVRQGWRLPQVAGWYAGSFRLRQALPGGPPYGTLDYEAEVLFHFEGTTAAIKIDRPGGSCLHRGELQQSGRYTIVSGSFDCGANDTGTFVVSGLEFTGHGVAGHLTRTHSDRTEFGRFGGPRY